MAGATAAPAQTKPRKKAEPPICKLPEWRILTVSCKGCKQAKEEAKKAAEEAKRAAEEAKKKAAEEARRNPKAKRARAPAPVPPPPPIQEMLGGLWVIYRMKPYPDLIPNASDDIKREVERFQTRFWVLGLTSDQGYLGPPVFDAANWSKLMPPPGKQKVQVEAMLSGLLPDAFQFLPGQEYEFYFVQHPSRPLAERILAKLNEHALAERTGTAAKSPTPVELFGEPIVLTPDADGKIELEESPETFWPSRSYKEDKDKFYGGWCLFEGMPSTSCKPVHEQVLRLQAHLGALRYPIGDQIWPYVFHVPLPTDDFNKCPDNEGIFDVRMMNAVFVFQRHSLECKPFQVDDLPPPTDPPKEGQPPPPKRPHEALVDYGANYAARKTRADRGKERAGLESDSNTWAYLRGRYLPAPIPPDPMDEEEDEFYAPRPRAGESSSQGADAGGAAPVHRKPDGVVYPSTGRAIERWLREGLRKPGEVLVSYMGLWMRPELAESLFAWDRLAKALGCESGVQFGSAFRCIFHYINGKLGQGVAPFSIHKTGLAADLGGRNYLYGQSGWHVVYEEDKAAALGKKKGWRLLGISKQPLPSIPNELGSCRETVRKALAKPLESSEKELADYGNAMRERLLGAVADPGFFSQYFQRTAAPWMYNPAREDGGAPAKDVTPEQLFESRGQLYQHLQELQILDNQIGATKALIKDRSSKADEASKLELEAAQERVDDLTAQRKQIQSLVEDWTKRPAAEKPDAKWSFLNLTRLGDHVGIYPIHSASGLEFGWAEFDAFNLSGIAEAIQTARDEPKVKDYKVKVTRDARDLEWRLEEFDLPFMKEWTKLLKEKVVGVTDPPRKGSKPRTAVDPGVSVQAPQFTFRLTSDPARDGDAAKVASLLREEPFASRYFWGSPLKASEPRVRTGREWASHVEAQAAALWKERDARAAAAAPPVTGPPLAFDPKNGAPPGYELFQWDDPIGVYLRYTPAPKPPPVDPFVISLLPVFLSGYAPPRDPVLQRLPFAPGDRVEVPRPGIARCQEWWHFQRARLFGRWGKKKDEGNEKSHDGVELDGTWRSLLELIGWSMEGLSSEPSETLHGRSGVGYAPGDLRTKKAT